MKKNNKFRNNGNSNAYSLNYKFDSISPAGKYSGTALDLIKRYNELAKEAHGSGNYIEMEMFRQYAEHYRKIVTEINERKNNRPEQPENKAPVCENSETTVSDTNAKIAETKENTNSKLEKQPEDAKLVTEAAAVTVDSSKPTLKLGKIASKKKSENKPALNLEKKEFMVVEIVEKPVETNTSKTQTKSAPRRRKTETAEAAAV